MIDVMVRCWDQWRVDYAGMVGCGASRSFAQLLAWRWVTGLGSALQMSGAQLYLADISASSNRARTMGTNQARMRQKLQTVLIGACNAFCNASCNIVGAATPSPCSAALPSGMVHRHVCS